MESPPKRKRDEEEEEQEQVFVPVPKKEPRMNITREQMGEDMKKCMQLTAYQISEGKKTYWTDSFDQLAYVRNIVLARLFSDEFWYNDEKTGKVGNSEYFITPIFDPANWTLLTGDDDNCDISPECVAEELKIVVQEGLKVIRERTRTSNAIAIAASLVNLPEVQLRKNK